MTATTAEKAATTQIYRVFIRATPQAIWDAITRPEWAQRYGYCVPVEYDMRAGGKFRALANQGMKGHGAPDVIIVGEVIELDPPRKLVQTWHPVWDPEGAAEPATTVTFENPGVQSSTVGGALAVDTMETYALGDYRPPGVLGNFNLDPASLGVFTVAPPNIYGAAGGVGQYLHNNRPLTDNGAIRLTLTSPNALYLGFWWSAGSPDEVDLFDNGSEVFSFTTQDVINAISLLPNASDYYGNPNAPFLHADSGEPYSFINFFATGSTAFDEIRFNGNLIELDNITISHDLRVPTGNAIPEANPGVVLLGVLSAFGGFRWSRRLTRRGQA